jgi:hypothetical protein
MLVAPDVTHTWSHFMYPYSLVACVGIGLAYRGPVTVRAVAALPLAAYAASAARYLGEPAWNSMAHSIHGRLAAVRGTSVVHSGPGLGTQVDLTVPLPAAREARGVTG